MTSAAANPRSISVPKPVSLAEIDQLPRSGENVYGFAVGVYPTDHPTLPHD